MKYTTIRLYAVILPAFLLGSFVSGQTQAKGDQIPEATIATNGSGLNSPKSQATSDKKKGDITIVVGPPIITKDPTPPPKK
jgi:hypothetical protein